MTKQQLTKMKRAIRAMLSKQGLTFTTYSYTLSETNLFLSCSDKSGTLYEIICFSEDLSITMNHFCGETGEHYLTTSH